MSEKISGDDYDQYAWTPNALERLAMLIRATIAYKNTSMQGFAATIPGLSYNTINRLFNGHSRTPREATLRKLAPHLYRPLSIKDGVLEIDPFNSFGGATGWVELVEWAQTEPESAPAGVSASTPLADFVLSYCHAKGLTQVEFEDMLVRHSGLSRLRLRGVLFGLITPTESDLYWLSHVVLNEDAMPYSFEFWKELGSSGDADADPDSDPLHNGDPCNGKDEP